MGYIRKVSVYLEENIFFNDIPHCSGGKRIGPSDGESFVWGVIRLGSHSYGKPFVRGINNLFRRKKSVRSRQFVWRIEILFGNRSSVRKGGYPFVQKIDILSGNRSSVCREDR